MRIGGFISYAFIILVLGFALMVLSVKLAEKKNSVDDNAPQAVKVSEVKYPMTNKE